MDDKLKQDATKALEGLIAGDQEAAERLMPLVYDQLRGLAQRYLRNERADHTLQPTALVHEAFLKLVDRPDKQYAGRTHFYAVAARAMRHILIDHARASNRLKRGGGAAQVALDFDLLGINGPQTVELMTLEEALDKLRNLDARQAQIVELRFFAGLTETEVAEVISVSPRTVAGDWAMAKAWLQHYFKKAAE